MSGSAAARATAATEVPSSVPIVRKPATPAARARASTAAPVGVERGVVEVGVRVEQHGQPSTRKRRRPISWPEAVTTSTVQRPWASGGKSAFRE